MNHSDSALPRSDPRALRLWARALGPETGPPLLVLHGITASHRYWLPRVLPLARRWRLHAPDLPGFGQSPKPFVDYTMDFFVEALAGFLEERGLSGRPLPIIGHSLGALLAIELVARRIVQAPALVLLNTPRFSDPESAHRIMLDGSASYRSLLTVNSLAATWAQMRRTPWRLRARYLRRLPWAVVADSRKFTFRSLSSTLEHCLLHYRVDPALDRLPGGIRILMLHGALDQVAPLGEIAGLAEHACRPRIHVIRGAGHNPFHTHTAECLRRIQPFLDPGEELAAAGHAT